MIQNCKNVKIENFAFYSEKTLNAQLEILASGKDWAEMKATAGDPCFVKDGELYAGDREGVYLPGCFFIECEKDRLSPDTADYFYRNPELRVTFSEVREGVFRAEGLKRQIPVGNTIVLAATTRRSCGILLDASKDTSIRKVTLYSGIGMGVIAQNCDGVEIDGMATRLRGNRKYTINADATHFVHCRGLIHIQNSFFEGQLDDALNVHSIYLRIAGKTKDRLLLKFGHEETKGIDILSPGSVVRVVDPDSQLPVLASAGPEESGRILEYTVKSVKKISLDYLEVELCEDISEIPVGYLMDEVSWQPEVLFENCVVQHNRARGMLLASAGKTVIRNNIFRTPGAAILFESSGKGWYESGGVEDVLITENVFANCKYAKWCKAIIEAVPREKTEEGRYYHKKIQVVNNVFQDCKVPAVLMANTEEFVFTGNRMENCEGTVVETVQCGKNQIEG